MTTSKSKILFLLSGSIAAFKACQLLSRMVKAGHQVQVVATPSVFQFVGQATLEGLSGRPVFHDLWEPGHAMDHIHLTRDCDLAVLCPASAHTIARLANGLADDAVTTLSLAWPATKPYWIFPAMNHEMFNAAATQENLSRLKSRGLHVAETQVGDLACGENGPGRMLEVDQIWDLLFATKAPGPRLLVTGGATREPIDGIRFLSNVSTGQTAAALCDRWTERGYQVTYLCGPGAQLPRLTCDLRPFTSYADLDQKMRSELAQNEFRAVIHAAAVSDYSPVSANVHSKMSSTPPELMLKLTVNPKILPRLREYARNKDIYVVGFKLTLNASVEETLRAARVALTPHVDVIVANDWRDVSARRDHHSGWLVNRDGDDPPPAFFNLVDLSQKLEALWSQPEKGNLL